MSRYAELSREELVARLAKYEAGGPSIPKAKPARPEAADQRPFNFAASATRHIAILVSYQGWPYSGLAIQPTSGYPTVEGELLKALEKTRLIEEGTGWEGCEFGRCGRTDRGVSGEGQVLNLWVRSTRKPDDGGHDLGDAWRAPLEEKKPRVSKPQSDSPPPSPKAVAKALKKQEKAKATTPVELNYPRLLNSVLPDAIRVLAWSPAPADFDSRFSCAHRHYKYAFHRHARAGGPPLDLDLMTQGAQNLIGEHDFRNLCKLDGSKQIENHSRRVMKAWFVEDEQPDMIIFNLIGTAFLWHQVRHIIAALFLVGTGVEPPSLISDLLDVERFPGKPTYVMGNPLPLTLHECAYPVDSGLDFRYGPYDGPWQSLAGEEREAARAQAELGRDAMERALDQQRQEAEIRAWQTGGALRRFRDVLGHSDHVSWNGTFYPTGAGELQVTKHYTPVTKRPMGETPDNVNAKWREQRGVRRAEVYATKQAAKEKAKEDKEAAKADKAAAQSAQDEACARVAGLDLDTGSA
ncbi:uncharacterized protein EHS24_005094 [Apiotrichum porosum]|uniref:Pseudouridine synthase I TruA alpha/beta domain-containing protein n=1 Tax=Apiotrichum porosum TaxID=105984 RepID=A0A427Y6V9_9TREE|nr:uncharacterized protein EHS24_005094 [Apiotrichum porosum]RSH86820.1 hypothetical protein EHS24_005094 [Apiotrichum porosum]